MAIDKNSLVAGLMKGRKPQGEEPGDDDASGDASDGLTEEQQAAYDDYAQAMQGDDTKAQAKALKAFLMLCDYDDEG